MGKYSLESYERYPVIRCRPEEDRRPVSGAGFSSFATVDVRPDDRPQLKEKTLLRLRISATEDAVTAEAAVRELASRYYRDPAVLGVTLAADQPSCSRMWETVAEAFSPKRFYVPVTDGQMLNYALKQGFFGGILAEVGENPLDLCEAFAANDAQRLFERYPVLVRFTNPAQADGRYALQWHACAVEGVRALAGPRIALRRLNYPRLLTSGGFAPLQFWWTNRGPSPLYGPAEVRLRLVRDGIPVATVLPGDRPERIPLADRVFNRIIRLPLLPEGSYRLEYGLFAEDGAPVRLANTKPTGNGYYDGDAIHLDHLPRPELENIWQTYRPDGYYPLEDPKVPGV